MPVRSTLGLAICEVEYKDDAPLKYNETCPEASVSLGTEPMRGTRLTRLPSALRVAVLVVHEVTCAPSLSIMRVSGSNQTVSACTADQCVRSVATYTDRLSDVTAVAPLRARLAPSTRSPSAPNKEASRLKVAVLWPLAPTVTAPTALPSRVSWITSPALAAVNCTVICKGADVSDASTTLLVATLSITRLGVAWLNTSARTSTERLAVLPARSLIADKECVWPVAKVGDVPSVTFQAVA